MSVSPALYKKLQKMEDKISDGQVNEVLILCTNLLSKKHLNTYEKSIIRQMQASVYIRSKNYLKAIDAYQAIIVFNALPKNNLLSIHYTLAQLFMQQAQYESALKQFKLWMAETAKPKSDAWRFLASIYIAQERYDAAIPAAEKALALAMPKTESHYQLLLGLYQRSNKSEHAISLLKEVLLYFPQNKEYWLQLFYMLNEVGKEKQALTILDLAYINGMLNDENEVSQLAQLHLYHQNPFRVAMILEQGIAEGMIKKSYSHLQLLASAWFNARDYQKAIKWLLQAAQLSGDGKAYYQLAQAYSELNDWERVALSLHSALKDTKFENRGAAYLLLGIAYTEQKKFSEAEKSFQHSLLDGKTKSEAEKWLVYIAEMDHADAYKEN
ncbi:MAG: tetratricopeptide repeat protein [Pseudomonadales bacterium]|nr:tetratricopeptide repeat protein [Pseudomonadales bacterium]